MTDRDRLLLGRLTTCVGGFSLEAVEALGSEVEADGQEVVDMLGRLVDASLVLVDDAGANRRFSMLEVVRQYGARLLDDSQGVAASIAHASHFLVVAERIFELESTDMTEMRRLGDLEIANFRAAIGLAYAADCPKLGLTIASNLCGYLNSRLLNRESLRWYMPGLEAIEDDHDTLLLNAATAATIQAFNAGDQEAGRVAAARLRRGLAGVEDPTLKGRMLSALGVNMSNEDPRAAQQYYLNALAFTGSDPMRSIAILNNMVEGTWKTGTIDPSFRIIERLEEILADLSFEPPLAAKIRAIVAARQGEWQYALAIADGAPGVDEVAVWSLQLVRAEALGALGRHREGLAVLDDIVEPDAGPDSWCARTLRAAAHLRLAHPTQAAEALEGVVRAIGTQAEPNGYGVPVGFLAAVAALDLGDAEAAAHWFGHAAAESERLKIQLRPSDVDVVAEARTRCQEALGSDRYDQLATAGAGTRLADLPAIINRLDRTLHSNHGLIGCLLRLTNQPRSDVTRRTTLDPVPLRCAAEAFSGLLRSALGTSILRRPVEMKRWGDARIASLGRQPQTHRVRSIKTTPVSGCQRRGLSSDGKETASRGSF